MYWIYVVLIALNIKAHFELLVYRIPYLGVVIRQQNTYDMQPFSLDYKPFYLFHIKYFKAA